jgi:uncharacterized protein (DUF1778 family)
MAKPGRPPLPAKERKSRAAFMRLRDEDMKLVKQAAQARGLEVCDWLRTEVLAAARRTVKRPKS